MNYAIETIALTKVFTDVWGRSKVYAVNDLNLQVKTNEVFGLLGPNGSGKTTTIKMLLGLLHPTKGKALMLGGDGADPKINKRIGFLPEESYLYRYLNPRETLDFYGRLFGLPRAVRKERTEALLEMVGLKAVANRSVGTFSKGMARRIGLAQALINDPDLLILDEPTTGLDPIGTRQIKDLIIKLAERGKTVLLCSHLLADVEDVCDRISILYGGQIQAEGQVRDLLQLADKRQITTSQLSDNVLERIRALIEAEHADCEISSPMERLETFFVRTVAEAQKKGRQTSGAVSTTQIGDFLSGTDRTAEVLNKLVGTSTPDKPAEAGAPETEKVQASTPSAPQADQDFLNQLTGAPATAAPTETSQPQQPEQTETPQLQRPEVDQDVLSQLVDPDKRAESRTERVDRSAQDKQGEPGDA